jgi:hypothetical protein
MRMNKKLRLTLFIIAGLIVLGFVIGVIGSMVLSKAIGCTEMYCPCEGVEGERPCNSCGYTKPIFVLGIVNVYQSCGGKEIIICENGEQADRRIDITECTTHWNIPGIIPRAQIYGETVSVEELT